MSDKRRHLKHEVYMRMAQQLARLSTCRRLSVGAVLLRRDGSVAGVGYNGALPGQPQPSQKQFETRVWQALRTLDPARPVFVESESRKIGNLAVPLELMAAMRTSPCISLEVLEIGEAEHGSED